MKRLQVNVTHCAILRQARGGSFPDPVWAASMAELAGARGIIAHLRRDRAYLKDRDVRLLRETVRGSFSMAACPGEDVVELACEVRPDMVVLVGEGDREPGLDLALPDLGMTIERIRAVGTQVSVHILPDSAQVRRAADLGVDAIELDTTAYAAAKGGELDVRLERVASAAVTAAGAGLSVAVGGALDYQNIRAVAAIPGIEEFNLGHAVMAHALFVGMERAVSKMLELVAD